MKRPWKSNSFTLAAVGIGASIILLLLINPSITRVLLTLPLVLLLPGYAMTLILFPRDAVSLPERLLLSIALSVVFTALTGLVLHWTPWGIRTTSLWLVLLLWLGVAVLIGKQRGIHHSEWSDAITPPLRPNFNLHQWMILVLAGLGAITAVHVARTPASRQGLEGYTLLWIRPTDEPNWVQLGVNSGEFATTKYQLQFEVNDVIREGPTLELKPGETWEGFIPFPVEQIEDEPLTVLLYRLDKPTEAYRRVVWWPETS